ncbi:MAG: M48 family metalloprotease [Acidobacteriaceae bacterium]|jgi:Zn-dependent protease with chaperone function
MRLRTLLLLLVALSSGFARPGVCIAAQTAAEAQADRFARHDQTAYTLPPEKLRKAVVLNHTRMVLGVAGTLWNPVQLVLVLALGAAARMRDLAVSLSKNRWVQGFAFVFFLLLTLDLLDLPLAIDGHRVALGYGLSVQGWGSWFADRAKSFGLEWLIGSLLVMLMFWVIRRSPARWWFWFWIPTVVVVIAGVFVTPYVIDPLFNQFEPLAKSDPALVEQLERVVERGGLSIPPERMFLMRASAKSTELNAYVTGFGASKRVVVWDTTIAKSTPDEIAFIFAHEMGHYALGHIALGVRLTCAALLPLFWLGYHGVRRLLVRFGAAWGIPSQQDWGALVALLLVLGTIATVAEPIENGFSRRIEHNADVYGQEAVHGIVADPRAVGQRSFQVLGEDSLDDPTPHPLFGFWFDTHPPVRFRAAFAEVYDPWAPGMRPKYFAK